MCEAGCVPHSFRYKRQGCVRYSTGILGTGMDVVQNLPKCPVPVLMSYRTYRSVRYRYWCCTEITGVSGTGMKVCTGTGGTGIHVVPNLPKCPVPVLMSYRTYRSVRYQYWRRTEVTEVSGTGIDVLPKLSKCPVPVCKSVPLASVPVVMSYRTSRSVRYRYWCRTEVTEVPGTGIDVVPNLPKYPVPVTPAVYAAGMPRYVPYRTHPW